jgi:hypothetical protein
LLRGVVQEGTEAPGRCAATFRAWSYGSPDSKPLRRSSGGLRPPCSRRGETGSRPDCFAEYTSDGQPSSCDLCFALALEGGKLDGTCWSSTKVQLASVEGSDYIWRHDDLLPDKAWGPSWRNRGDPVRCGVDETNIRLRRPGTRLALYGARPTREGYFF